MIQGLQKTSLVDYPGCIASTVFFSGCSMRCPFCHNPSLVRGELPEIGEDEIISFLLSRRRFIDGVCFTGGEPTVHPSLPSLLRRVKDLGFKVKLDTNGTNPSMLREIIGNGLVDYIAMDIKSSPDGYAQAAGLKVDLNSIMESVELIQKSGVEYEFRTTAVPGLFDENVLLAICGWLSGSERYFLQQFDGSSSLMDPALSGMRPFPPDEMERFAGLARPFFGVCEVRNI